MECYLLPGNSPRPVPVVSSTTSLKAHPSIRTHDEPKGASSNTDTRRAGKAHPAIQKHDEPARHGVVPHSGTETGRRILHMVEAERDSMQEFWNKRYGAEEYAYGIEANLFFKQQLRLLSPGRLLLPGEGEGRNAVHAARNGWTVHAVDYSEEGRKKALSLATKRGVSITYVVTDLATYEAAQNTFDVAAFIFVHFPPDQRKLIHARAIGALKPGGVLIIEAFAESQLMRDTGGPRSAELLYSMDDLLDDVSGMEILHSESLTTDILEGPFHNGAADVHRLVVRKTEPT